MTDEEWARIKPMVEAEEEARRNYMAALGWNKNVNPRAALEQEVELQRLQMVMFKAERVLRTAKQTVLGIT